MILPDFTQERKLWEKGFKYVIGVDEVGRGAFAGPVSTAAVVFKIETENIIRLGINDSKLLKPIKRTFLSKHIKNHCLAYSITNVGLSTINKKGIVHATNISFRKSIKNVLSRLDVSEEKVFLLADGFNIKHIKGIGLKNQKAIIKGDRISISIAAASVIAKVHRDNLMKKLAKEYPEYGFEKHKGYGTLEHRNAIKKYGLSEIHRKSFNLARFT